MNDATRAIPDRVIAVAIPARDEAERIVACLEALDAQTGPRATHIVLLVNNSEDGTAGIARATRLDEATTLHVLERSLPSEDANAGHARRLAMDAAASLLRPGDILMTTDADGLVDPDWTFATSAELDAGAEVVAGWVELHPVEWGAIPTSLHEDDAKECAYDSLCDEIHARLDPDLHDPWPRHTQHSGASIALTVAAYRRCGGIPRIASGEDRALIEALRRVDARIRHSPAVHATVSGRTVGRAAGGMADTILRRLTQSDEFLDDRLEPARDCARRATARALAGSCHRGVGDPASLARLLGLRPREVDRLLAPTYFGAAWAAIERAAPVLRRRRVAVADLAAETGSATALLRGLRQSLMTGLPT